MEGKLLFRQAGWRNINIGGKYLIAFLIMAVTFVIWILITFFFLSKTSEKMEETVVKNEVASQVHNIV